MSLNDAMSNGKSRKKVSVKNIRMNQLNAYDAYNIDELACLIKRDGQLENLTVYAEDLNDGKSYTLIGGHRRYLAISKLLEMGESDGLADVVVINKPISEIDEKLMIQSDNAQRIKTKEEIKWEIQVALEKWEFECAQGRKPHLEEGEKKRDWVGKQVGLKGRQVQEYLTGRFSSNQNQEPTEEHHAETNTTEISDKNIIKGLKKILKQVDKTILDLQELGYTEKEINLTNIKNMIIELSETF